jgi:hypothetical protein
MVFSVTVINNEALIKKFLFRKPVGNKTLGMPMH